MSPLSLLDRGGCQKFKGKGEGVVYAPLHEGVWVKDMDKQGGIKVINVDIPGSCGLI